MKILFADSAEESGRDYLADLGHECTYEPGLKADELPDAISDHQVLVVRSTKVSADTIAAAGSLELIVRAGAGTNTIDTQAAADAGIYVCNVPGKNAIAVAELTLGLLLAIDRRIGENTADLRAGYWNKSIYAKADGLYGKQMAIVGLGDIGLAVAERAKAFGISVSAMRRPNRSAETEQRIRRIGIRLVEDLDELLHDADIVSVHVPSNSETSGMIDAAFLARMPEGSILLNTSRGDVIDEAALLDALNGRDIRAGLDVFVNEPPAGSGNFDSAIAQHPSVVGTHHIGASTTQAQRAIADGTISVIQAFTEGRAENCVNMARFTHGTHTLSVRHLDRVGVLAQVLEILRTAGHNVQRMQNQVFDGGHAAVAAMEIVGGPTDAVLDKLGKIDEVIAVTVRERNGEQR